MNKVYSLVSKDLKFITTIYMTRKTSGVYRWSIIKLNRYIFLQRGCGKKHHLVGKNVAYDDRKRSRARACLRACLREREGCSDRNVTWM